MAIDSRPLPNDRDTNFAFLFVAMFINMFDGSAPGDRIKISVFLLFKLSIIFLKFQTGDLEYWAPRFTDMKCLIENANRSDRKHFKNSMRCNKLHLFSH